MVKIGDIGERGRSKNNKEKMVTSFMDGRLYMVHTLEALRLGIIACVTAVYVRYVC